MQVTFPEYDRFTAILVDSLSHGFVREDRPGKWCLHIGKTAPQWLKECRDRGPYPTRSEARAAIKAAAAANPKELVLTP